MDRQKFNLLQHTHNQRRHVYCCAAPLNCSLSSLLQGDNKMTFPVCKLAFRLLLKLELSD